VRVYNLMASPRLLYHPTYSPRRCVLGSAAMDRLFRDRRSLRQYGADRITYSNGEGSALSCSTCWQTQHCALPRQTSAGQVNGAPSSGASGGVMEE
jgi:hypothetical protein